MENQTTKKGTFFCRTRRMANYLLENGAVMKTIVPSNFDGKRGLAFIFKCDDLTETLIERWKTEKDTYRNPV